MSLNDAIKLEAISIVLSGRLDRDSSRVVREQFDGVLRRVNEGLLPLHALFFLDLTSVGTVTPEGLLSLLHFYDRLFELSEATSTPDADGPLLQLKGSKAVLTYLGQVGLDGFVGPDLFGLQNPVRPIKRR